MIPFDFEYYAPQSIQEGVEVFQELEKNNLSPVYYGGGTEIITQARKETLSTGAIIDLKHIPECLEHKEEEGYLILGSALSLTTIIQKNLFPLLSKACRPIADRTVRNKLTLGGNICGRLPYREAVLPLLVADTKVVVAGLDGTRSIAINEVYDKRFQLKKGEFIVQVRIPKETITFTHFNDRNTKHSMIDYPLTHIVGVKDKDRIKVSFSGVSPFPFRSENVESILNDKNLSVETRIQRVLENFPFPIKEDPLASGEYRKTLLEKSLYNMFLSLEGVLV